MEGKQSGPVITFCMDIILKMNKNEKQHNTILGFPVLILTLLMTIADLTFLFMTSSRDPGIVQRNTRPPDGDEAYNATTPSMEWISGRAPHLRLPRTKDVIVNGFVIKVKYCDTCMLYRPPRASHCSICNNCVKKFDHHCPWVGQCIGLRNYRFFSLFISTSAFLCIFIFIFSWLNIIDQKKHYGNSMWNSMKHEVVSLVLIVFIFIMVWFVGGLTVLHCYLVSTNQTTYENFRYRYDKKDNPHNNGYWRNFKEVFFSKVPPSEHDFRSFVDEEMIEVGPDTPNIGMNLTSMKEKFGIKMGNKFAVGDNMTIPSILQNLDYSSIEDNEDVKDLTDDDAFDPLGIHTSQNCDRCSLSHSTSKSCSSENEAYSNERAAKEAPEAVDDERNISQRYSNMV
ncbi:putative protein S-acyltransferase 4 isoform X3 [Curcuma longa]|uniref:putative protein S-acyltransferase 4 isoform X3 n=1 Tax=Curcuma longa TaxID=136217 RepID=UPI003D9F2FE7